YFQHSRVKSYLKHGRAFRIETVVNDPGHLGLLRGLTHLEELAVKTRDEPPAVVRGPQPCGSATLGSWPCRRLVRHRAHRHRVHQPEPSRPGEHPAPCPVLGQPDEL